MKAKFDGARITSSLAGTWLPVSSSSSCDCGGHQTKYEVVPEIERTHGRMLDFGGNAESHIVQDGEPYPKPTSRHRPLE